MGNAGTWKNIACSGLWKKKEEFWKNLEGGKMGEDRIVFMEETNKRVESYSGFTA